MCQKKAHSDHGCGVSQAAKQEGNFNTLIFEQMNYWRAFHTENFRSYLF